MWLAALALLIGEALVIGGIWFIYPPAAAIVLGAQVIPAALLAGRRA